MLENIDTERKVEFKRSEMAAEHQRREKLKVLEERKRIQAEDDYRKQQVTVATIMDLCQYLY